MKTNRTRPTCTRQSIQGVLTIVLGILVVVGVPARADALVVATGDPATDFGAIQNALDSGGEVILQNGPNGEVLQADQTSNEIDTIIWRPVHLLATDGTDDGIYTVTVTPVDSTGTAGQSRQLTLIYDTQPPEVVSASPVDINADITHVGQQLIAVCQVLGHECF